MKGEAVGWSSTLANIRVPETVNAFSKAIEYCPEEGKAELSKKCVDVLSNLHCALLKLRMDNFKKWPSDDNVKKIESDLTIVFFVVLSRIF